MIITVVYGRVTNLDAARRCPRCNGTGIRPEGWAYLASEALGLALGDLVECPPTPYSSGQNVQATVVGLNGEPLPGKGLKTIVGRAVVTS